jgi:NAD-dependent epimerase/dehydratase family protein
VPSVRPRTMATLKSGVCCICGANGKLSFEHLPPEKAFNDDAILLARIEKLRSDDNPDSYEERSRKQQPCSFRRSARCGYFRIDDEKTMEFIIRPNEAAFRVDATSTYNVLEAARRLGIRNIVWTSSETLLLGLPFDEQRPYGPNRREEARPNTGYALSKLMGEEMAKQFRYSGSRGGQGFQS